MPIRRYLDQRLRLPQLRMVDAIDAQGSLLKVAAALGLSQPALTKGLQELEALLQTRLFDRHARGVRTTEAGHAFVRAARHVLAELRRVDLELDGLPARGQTVALGALPVAAAGVLPGVLARLRQTHPTLRVRLQEGRTEDLLPLLATGEIELIVGRLYAPPAPDGFDRQPIWTEPISLLARSGHPLFDGGPVGPGDLTAYDLVLPTITQRVARDIDAVLDVLGLTQARPLRTSSYGLIRELLHGTDMLSAMPRLMMVGDLLRGTLRVVPLPFAAADRPAGLIQRARPATDPARAFIDCLRDYVGELAGRGLLHL